MLGDEPLEAVVRERGAVARRGGVEHVARNGHVARDPPLVRTLGDDALGVAVRVVFEKANFEAGYSLYSFKG